MPPPVDRDDALSLRLDVWLWRARLFRTRSACAEAVRAHGIRLTHAGQTRRTDKPGHAIIIGDIVTFARAGHIETCEIVSLGTRRGDASEAAGLFRRLNGDAV